MAKISATGMCDPSLYGARRCPSHSPFPLFPPLPTVQLYGCCIAQTGRLAVALRTGMSGGIHVQRALVVGILTGATGLLTTIVLLQVEDLTVFVVCRYRAPSARQAAL